MNVLTRDREDGCRLLVAMLGGSRPNPFCRCAIARLAVIIGCGCGGRGGWVRCAFDPREAYDINMTTFGTPPLRRGVNSSWLEA